VAVEVASLRDARTTGVGEVRVAVAGGVVVTAGSTAVVRAGASVRSNAVRRGERTFIP
jgi:hypothetical protein